MNPDTLVSALLLSACTLAILVGIVGAAMGWWTS
jgi:hypothetical protein